MPDITVTLKQNSLTTSEGVARQHSVLVDRPTSKGGSDEGMMGGEMLLIALGGCFMSNLLELVRNREATISDIHIDIVGTLAGIPPRYTEIYLNLSAKADDTEQLEKFVTMAERSCIVANSIGPAIDLKFHIALAET